MSLSEKVALAKIEKKYKMYFRGNFRKSKVSVKHPAMRGSVDN